MVSRLSRLLLGVIAVFGRGTILLSSNNSALTVPPSVTVPPGSMLATFSATITALAGEEGSTITAGYLRYPLSYHELEKMMADGTKPGKLS